MAPSTALAPLRRICNNSGAFLSVPVSSICAVAGSLDFDVDPQKEGRLYTWTDENADGFIQRSEMRFGDVMHDGKPLSGELARWTWRMNDDFIAAGVTDHGYHTSDPCLIVAFRPSGFTSECLTRYDVPSVSLPSPRQVDSLMPLLFAPFKGKTVCVMYDYKVPGASADVRMAFSIPWRTVHVDCVCFRS